MFYRPLIAAFFSQRNGYMASEVLRSTATAKESSQSIIGPLQHWAAVHQALMEAESNFLTIAMLRRTGDELESARRQVAMLRDLDDAAYLRIMSGHWSG